MPRYELSIRLNEGIFRRRDALVTPWTRAENNSGACLFRKSTFERGQFSPTSSAHRHSIANPGFLFHRSDRPRSTDEPARGWKMTHIALGLFISLVSSFFVAAQQRVESRQEQRCGAYWTNLIKNEAVEATTADEIQELINTYWSSGGACDSWGHRWLAKWAVFSFGMKASELWDDLNRDQQEQVEEILLDAIDESTFFLGFSCGIRKGDTCSEDYVSMVIILALVKNLFPHVAQQAAAIDEFEEKYINLTFSDEHGYLGLIREQKPWDSEVEVKLYNHGEESPVYALCLMTGMNNAIFTYQIANKRAPQYYEHPNQLPLFRWAQSKAAADGSEFLYTCHRVGGKAVSCNDSGISDTNPHVVPGGRFIGHAASLEGYSFVEFDDSEAAGNYDIGRYYFYQTWNPKPYPFVRSTD